MTIERMLAPEDMVMRLSPELSALAWVNFIKNLQTHTAKEAIVALKKRLTDYLTAPTKEVKSPLYQDPEESVAELLGYLKGELKPEQSKLWPLLNGETAKHNQEQEITAEYLEQLETIKEKTAEIELILKKINSHIVYINKLFDSPLPFDVVQTEFIYKALIHELRSFNTDFTKFRRRISHDEIDKTWIVKNDFKTNPDGVERARTWAKQTIKDLEESRDKANKILGELEIIRADVERQLAAKSN